MSLFASWIASPPPDAAIEIAADQVCGRGRRRARRRAGRAGRARSSRCLPARSSRRSPRRTSTIARLSCRALRAALDRAGIRPRRVALVIPDLSRQGLAGAVRHDCPPRREDLDQLGALADQESLAVSTSRKRSVTSTPGVRGADGSAEFLIVDRPARRGRGVRSGVRRARRSMPGLVDLATLSVVNLFLGGAEVPDGRLAGCASAPRLHARS